MPMAARPKTALTAEQRVKRFLSMGQAAIRQGLVDEAMEYYQQAQQLAPNDPEIKNAIQGMMLDFVKGSGGGKKAPAATAPRAPVAWARPAAPAPAASTAPVAESAEAMERRIREKVMLEMGQKAGAPASAAPPMGPEERRRLVEQTRSQVLAAASLAPSASSGAYQAPSERAPEEPDTETMAEIYMKQGHWADALKAYESILRKDPSRADVAQMVMDLRARTAPIRPEPPPDRAPVPEPAEPVAVAAPRARSKPRVSYV